MVDDKKQEKEDQSSSAKETVDIQTKDEQSAKSKPEEKIMNEDEEDDDEIGNVVLQMSLNMKPDYSLFIYPIHVLATNRVLHTIISRNENHKNNIRLFQDLKDINKVFGIRAFFFGLFPYCLNVLVNDLEVFGSHEEEFVHPIGRYWYYFSLFLWNPLNILTVRMQSVDYPYRKFRHALADMVKHDRLSLIYRGLFPILSGQITIYLSMALATYLDLMDYKYTPLMCGSLFLAGCALAHPMYLIGMRVQYGSFHKTPIEKEAYQNYIKALVYVRQRYGISGFYKGFAPAMIIYSAFYYEELKRMIFDRVIANRSFK